MYLEVEVYSPFYRLACKAHVTAHVRITYTSICEPFLLPSMWSKACKAHVNAQVRRAYTSGCGLRE